MIILEVFGDPAPQGSKRVFNGRVVEAAGQKLKVWRKAIADACLPFTDQNIWLGPIRLEVDFFVARPKTVKQNKRPFPIVPPDLDKLIRAVGDGIGQSEMIWGDDSQIVELSGSKRYADDRDPGAIIRIIQL